MEPALGGGRETAFLDHGHEIMQMPQLHSRSMPARYATSLQSLFQEGTTSLDWRPWNRRSAMNDRVVLITGALTGIGRATALAFARDGARLVVSGRREVEGKALEAELRRLGAEAAFIQADVRRDDEVSNLVDKTVARF